MRQSDCTRNCWIVGAILGLVVMLFVSGLGQTHWLGGLFLGLIAFLLAGGFLVWLVCDGKAPGYDIAAGLRNPQVMTPPPAEPAILLPVKTEETAEVPLVTLAAPPAKTEKSAAKQDEAKSDKPKAKAKAGKKAKPDDLKQIEGIGPKMELRLNEMGVTRFDQIAQWGPEEVADYAARLGRRGGRIEAGNWVEQARELSGVRHG